MEIKNSTLLWIGVGAVGAYLLLKKKDSSPVTSATEPKKIKLPVEPIVPETPSEMERPKEDYLPVDLGLGAGGPPPPYEGAYYVEPIKQIPDYRLPEYSFNPIDEYVYNIPVYKTQVEPVEYPYSYSTSVAERQINQPIYL